MSYLPNAFRASANEVQLQGLMRAAAREMDAMIASWGGSEEELMDEYKQIKSTARKSKNTRDQKKMIRRALVLDANILIRGVLGKRVRRILETHVSFFVPEAAYIEAERHLAALVVKRGGDPDIALRLLTSLLALATLLAADVYQAFEADSRSGLGTRDQDDWSNSRRFVKL